MDGYRESRHQLPLIDVGAVGAVHVRNHQVPVLLLQPSVHPRNCSSSSQITSERDALTKTKREHPIEEIDHLSRRG